MTNFEKITKSPDTLAEFLRGLPVLTGPWDEAFQKRFCAECLRADCDDSDECPYEAERNNPGWWLGLTAAEAGAAQ